MIENVEYKGKWRLPESETWINGIVKFTPEERISLEIFGTFGKDILDHPFQNIILGETTDGDVTLIGNYFHSSISNFNQISVDVYTPTFIVKGIQFNSLEEIIFREVSFSLFNLFDWCGISGLYTKHLNRSSFTINYDRPNDIEFTIHENCTGRMTFLSPFESKNNDNGTVLSEECEVSFKYNDKTQFKTILNDMSIFQRFITLSTFEQSYPLKITFQDDDYFIQNEKFKHKLSIQCLYQDISYDKKYKVRNSNESLLRFQDIQEDFPKLIRNWFKTYQEIGPSINLLMGYFIDKNKMNREKFMEIVRGLETFHRSYSNKTRYPEFEFKEKIKSILFSIELSNSDKKWLKEELQYSNELRLKDRLIDLITDHSNKYIKNKIVDIDTFCRRVVMTRNYYTHFGNKSKGKILTNYEIVGVTENLTGLLISCVMCKIGVFENVFEDRMDELL